MASILGLDIGGANLKAAHANGTTLMRPFPLWKRPADLPAELARLLAPLPPYERLAVTMTGELCDCFATRREGVAAILDAVEQVAADRPITVWTTKGTFLDMPAARGQPLSVAAANWLALATFAGRFAPAGTAVLFDIGSTTSDVIPLVNGVPVPTGCTDSDRLQSSELVYTGVRRTPVCALLASSVMAELFATTLDVYLLLGDLTEGDDTDTADGRPATRHHAHARLARMLGGDGECCSHEETLGMARKAAATQETFLEYALRRVARKLPAPPARYVVSGSGEFLARRVLQRVGVADDAVTSLGRELGPSLSTAACAHAVAVLAGEMSDA